MRLRTDLALCLPTLAWAFAGCSAEPVDAVSVPQASFVPRAVAELRALDLGAVHFRLSIDGTRLPDRFPVSGASTSVPLDLPPGDTSSHEILVQFYLQESDEVLHLLAEGGQSVARSDGENGDGRLVLSGLFYRYTDTDDDGAFDVHELAVPRDDLDGDNLFAHEDADSDNDGTPDGDDPSPYGASGTDGVAAAELLIDRSASGETSVVERVRVGRIVGASGETRRLGATGTPIPLRAPEGWPLTTASVTFDDLAWTAFEIDADERCPDWRIDIDASSFASSLSAVGLLHFRRVGDEPGVVVPIAADTVTDLDVYGHDGPLDGDGPFNDALRVILVPPGTVGWMELRTERGLTGEACALNLSVPAVGR